MAGFLDRLGLNPVYGSVAKAIKNLASLGMDYDDMVVKQSRAVGVTEAAFGNQGYLPEEFLYSLAMSDIGQKKFIAYFEKDYKERRKYLRTFAMNGEIDFITETIADEAIVYDDNMYFATPDCSMLKEYLSDDKEEDVIATINDQYKRLYNAFHFKEGHDAWQYFKQFLIDGFLSFEIIYSKDAKKIIGFKELDAASLRPGVIQDSDGVYRRVWVQYEDSVTHKRELYDSQIIYISYAKGNFTARLSYVERLIRSFNLLRLLENSRIIWNIMNSSFRLKMIVPIGTKSPQKARESLAELMHIYKEDVNLNVDSGELTINGQPNLQFYKNYLFPSKNGEQPEVETIGGDGPDLSDTEALKYFSDKLWKDSKVPFARFSNDSAGDTLGFTADAINREEIRFSKFINRLRSIFQEILLKPLWLQLTLDMPELKDDVLIKQNLGLRFNEENVFKEAREQQIFAMRAEFIQTLQGITVPGLDADGMSTDIPYFDAGFLIDKYLKMLPSDIKNNESAVVKRKTENDEQLKKIKASQAETTGF